MAPTKQPSFKQASTPEDFYKRTIARIQGIQAHLSQTPRGSRLKGKVCVITGVGSMKGIGYAVTIPIKFHSSDDMCRRATALLFAHEGKAPRSALSHSSGSYHVKVPSIYIFWTFPKKTCLT